MASNLAVSSALDALYRAKAVPSRLPDHYISRPHIVELIRWALPRPLILVQAGPGAGKTTALAAFAATLPHRPPSYRLSGLDTGPVAFLTGICLAVKKSLPGETDYPHLLAAIAESCQSLSSQAILIDDVHRVDHAWLADTLLELSVVLPSRCSLVVAVRSRTVVADVIARALGSDARLALIDGAALQLRDDEIDAFTQQFGKPEAAGCRWPGAYAAASYMAHALSVQEELICRLSDEERDALRTLAVIDEAVTPETASVLLGQSLVKADALFRRFAADGLLVAEEGPGIYRLSREVRGQLDQLSEHEQRLCRRRVAQTLIRSEPVLAARYALAADDVALAVQALDGVEPLAWMVRTPGVAEELANQLPLEALSGAWWPRLCRARGLLRQRKIAEGRSLLFGEETGDLALRCETIWLRTFADLQDGRLLAASEAVPLFSNLAEAAQGVAWPLSALAYCRAGTMAGISGDLRAAKDHLDKARLWLGDNSTLTDGPRLDLQLDIYMNLGLTLQHLGHTLDAVQFLEMAVKLAERRYRSDLGASCLNNLASALHDLAQPGKALEVVNRGMAVESISPRDRAMLVLTRADILADLGSFEQAMGLYAFALELAAGKDWSGLPHGCQLGMVRCALAINKPDVALGPQRWLASATDDQHLYFTRMAGGLFALLSDHNPALAVRYFGEACQAYAPLTGAVGQSRARFWLMVAHEQSGQRSEAEDDLRRLASQAHVLGGQYELELAAPIFEVISTATETLHRRFLQPLSNPIRGALARPSGRSRKSIARIRLLGLQSIELDGVDLSDRWEYRRAEELFYFGVVHAQEGFTKTDAEMAFDPDASPNDAPNLFSSALTRLRATLSAATGVDGRLLVERDKGGRYRIHLELLADRVDVDLLHLVALADAVRAPDPAALHVRGELLARFSTEWADLARFDWMPRIRHGLGRAGDLGIREGKFDVAEQAGRSLLKLNLDDDRGHRLLLQAFALRNDSAAARDHLIEYARDLKRRDCPNLPKHLTNLFAELFAPPLVPAGIK